MSLSIVTDLRPNDTYKPVVPLVAGDTRRKGDAIVMGNVVLFERRNFQAANAPRYSRQSHRLREIEKIIKARHGNGLPDTDDANIYLEAVAHAYQAQQWRKGTDSRSNLVAWCSVWAKAIPQIQIAETLDSVSSRKHDLSSADAADLLRVSWLERERLNLRTFGAYDLTHDELQQRIKDRKRFRDRIRIAEKRRAKGDVPRDVFLAQSNERQKPWEAEGISRATWYRRQKAAQTNCANAKQSYLDSDTCPSRIDIYTTCDTPVSNDNCGTVLPSNSSLPCKDDVQPELGAFSLVEGSGACADVYPAASSIKAHLRKIARHAGCSFAQIAELVTLAEANGWNEEQATQATLRFAACTMELA